MKINIKKLLWYVPFWGLYKASKAILEYKLLSNSIHFYAVAITHAIYISCIILALN